MGMGMSHVPMPFILRVEMPFYAALNLTVREHYCIPKNRLYWTRIFLRDRSVSDRPIRIIKAQVQVKNTRS